MTNNELKGSWTNAFMGLGVGCAAGYVSGTLGILIIVPIFSSLDSPANDWIILYPIWFLGLGVVGGVVGYFTS